MTPFWKWFRIIGTIAVLLFVLALYLFNGRSDKNNQATSQAQGVAPDAPVVAPIQPGSEDENAIKKLKLN